MIWHMNNDIAQRTADENIGLVRFLYADNGGIIRGKATAASRIAERIDSGIGHTVAMMAMSMMDELQPVPGMGPVGEVRIVPDVDTFTPLPYAPGAAAMLADLVKADGTPWEACTRTFLKNAVAALGDEGYELMAAFEPEFTLGTRDPAGLLPVDDSLCYSATGFMLAHDYAIDLVDAAVSQGLDVEHYYPELGPGQQEISIHYTDPLHAADNHVLLRETARGVALRHGLWATFAPKPLPDQAGNGAHLHASLWRDGVNVFADPQGLSEVGQHFVAGVRAHLPALVALTCASVNSYRRLAPRTWAGAWNAFGFDNREVAVRVCSALGAEGSVNLELKPSDSTANPYLALGAFIHAGLDGLRGKLDPGEPVDVDPAGLSDTDRAERGITQLPTSLGEALDALEADRVLTEALGPLRTQAYLAVKRSEVAHFAEHDLPYELYHHAMKF
jgi:glutamine synthetase